MTLRELFFPTPTVQFEPVRHDSDELLQSIKLDSQGDTEIWDLKAPLDPIALEAFWTAVVKDIQSDPEWFSFVED